MSFNFPAVEQEYCAQACNFPRRTKFICMYMGEITLSRILPEIVSSFIFHIFILKSPLKDIFAHTGKNPVTNLQIYANLTVLWLYNTYRFDFSREGQLPLAVLWY